MSHPRNAEREARRERQQHTRKSSRAQRIVFPSLTASLALTIATSFVFGASASSRYDGIVERNVFSLKPPTPPGPPPPTPSPAVKLTLTGITTILGKKQALLSAAIPPIGSSQPAKQESYILAEGQRDGEVEVVSIDESAGIVKVINRGSPETLDFVNNGAKIVSTGPGPGAPGAPGAPGTLPQVGIPAPQVGGPGGGMRAIPPRVPHTPTTGSPNQQSPGMGTGAQASTLGQSGYERQMSPEEQAIMMEVERERTRDAVNSGSAPPLPPTPLTPEGSPGYVPPPSDVPNLPQ